MPSGLILGIESSCDETSAAVVRHGVDALSNVVASQLVHADFGGVVPELASREHLRAIVPVTEAALREARIDLADVDAVAVTEGPGLAGALLIGITFAKALAFAAGKPLIAVNHLEGHIHAVLMESAATFATPETDAPLLALVVSGGHTHLYLAHRRDGLWTYRNVGKTVDDAAGEAYDKAAKLLGLPYPGGPWMDALATHGDPLAVPFRLGQIKAKATGNTPVKLAREAPLAAGDDATRFDLSFSGIKTAVRRHIELQHLAPAAAVREQALRAAGLLHAKPSDPVALGFALEHLEPAARDVIASFQHAVVRALTRTTLAAAEHFGARGLLVSGGVSANRALREHLTAEAARRGLPLAFPRIALATDNAAMIAAAAWPKLQAGRLAPTTLEPTPQLRLG